MPSTSVFDPDEFMGADQTVDLDVNYTPFDEGEYVAQLGEEIRATQSEREGRVSVRLDIPWLLLDDKAREKSGMDNPQFYSAIFVEMEDNGAIASGPNKNIALGQLRKALGQDTGKKWSPGMLRGAGPVKIYVTQRPDREDPAIVRNRAVRYAPMS